MSNGWYQLERGKPKIGSPLGVKAQYNGIYRRPSQPVAPRPVPRPEPELAPAPPPEEPSPVPLEQTDPTPNWEQVAELQSGEDQAGGAAPHSQTVGPEGPVVLQDMVLHETLGTFVTEKTAERVVHGKGWGAFGVFQCHQPMGAYTTLPFLQASGQTTQTVSRFSLAVSNRGTPDTSRNVRGFSTKFYTEDGVFDLLCNHLPVFAVRDALRFPEFIRTLLPSPVNNLIDHNRFWEFVARAPESIHFITWLYSDQGTVKSLRHLRSYGVNTYVWQNREGQRSYVKYHWLPADGVECIGAAEAVRLAGEDPDVAGRDLYQAIERGEYPSYELRVQLMDPAEGAQLPFDPLDDTKIWEEERYPLLPVGRLTLNRNPENYIEQVEKLAFSPGNLLPGAELSNDKILQGRSFIYSDAQRHRLGPGYRRIPVNGQADWTPEGASSTGLGVETCGVQVRGDIPRQDDFSQAGERYRTLTPQEREGLAANIAGELCAAPEAIRQTVLGYLGQADEAYGRQVREKMEGPDLV